MIWATVLERRADKTASQKRGDYGFLQIPSVGDLVQLWNLDRDQFDLMEVLFIEHVPAPDPGTSNYSGPQDATVLIVCKLVDEIQ